MQKLIRASLLASTFLGCSTPTFAGQAPFAASAPDLPLSGRDRVYAAEQFSNTVSVTNPSTSVMPLCSMMLKPWANCTVAPSRNMLPRIGVNSKNRSIRNLPGGQRYNAVKRIVKVKMPMRI